MLSARLQDAAGKLKDFVWLPKAAALRRPVQPLSAGKTAKARARACAPGCVSTASPRFNRPTSSAARSEAVVSLLAIRFTPSGEGDPAGVIELVLAGGGTIRLTVECIDAELADLTGPWAARARPSHEDRALMARRLNSRDKNFAADFEALLFAKREIEEDVAAAVRGIIADVRARGDAALVELTNKFDRANITAANLKVSAAEIEAALAKVTAEQKDAIEIAATRIEAYHRRQLPKDESFKDDTGAHLGLALDGGRQRRSLCAGRHRQLSIIGSDECDSRQGRGRRRAS